MDASPPGPRGLPDSSPGGAEARSDPGLDPGVPTRSQASKREMPLSEVTQNGRRGAAAVAIDEASARPASSHRQEEGSSSPLRLALARRSVKRKIFTYMDRGDKKTDIESRTGLSHQCIKWHRRLWRTECSHPRPRSRKISKSSSRRAQSPSPRHERPSRKRPACDGKGELSVASGCGSDKQRRKRRAVKQSKGQSLRVGAETPESGGGECAERETKGSGLFADKENVPGRDEAMAMSGKLKVLPIRALAS